MAALEYGSLPFDEQIEFFQSKLRLDTQTWADIRKEMHARAFVVAGARGEVLADFERAVNAAIEDGETLEDFRKHFDAIVARHGWDYNGTRNWRSRVIYDTNLRTSYAAGRYKQLQAIKQARPYWEFHHTPVAHPRVIHEGWDGKILSADDPWWDAHYPPDGWGCQCIVYSLSPDELAARGKDGPDEAPNDGTYEVERGPFQGAHVPVGIDPGWDYNVGKAAWGKTLTEQALAEERAGGGMDWQPFRAGGITDHDWQFYNRPAIIPLDEPQAELAARVHTQAEVAALLRHIIGGDEQLFNLHGFPALLDADYLGQHVRPRRAVYLPLLPEILDDPFEIWLGFMRQPATGKIALRARVIKGLSLGPDGRSTLFVLDVQRGLLRSYTFVESNRFNNAQNNRWGLLLYGRAGP